MEQLRAQVRRVQWWLGAQRFLKALGWCCFATLLAALALIAADKFWPLGVEAWVWGGGAVAVGVLAALVWAAFRHPSPLEAAIEIDRRCALKERVSSALALSPRERQSEAGQALIADAARRAERIAIGAQFRVVPGRQILLPLVPGGLAVLVALLVQPAVVDNPADATTQQAVKRQIEQSGQSLRHKLEEQRKRAQQEGLKDAQNLFRRLEEEAKELAIKQTDRKLALVKLNDLAQQLQKRQQQLGGPEQVQRQFEQLKDMARGPADKLLEALARGNVKKAVKELEKLKDDLANDRLSPKQREELAKQLEEMRQKLQKAADAHKEAEKDLEKRIEQARQTGQKAEADRLQEQLDQLRQQSPQMEQLQKLAEKLGACAQCVQSGQVGQAGEMLADLEKDLQRLQEQLEEFEMLQNAKSDLAEARDQMICPDCGGAGCGRCRKPGDGMGAGRGAGERPEEKDDVDFYDTKAAVKTGRGAVSVVGEVEGPNVKGNLQQQMQEQFQSARQQAADPLTNERIPRKQREHAKEYFDRLREGR